MAKKSIANTAKRLASNFGMELTKTYERGRDAVAG